MTIAVVGCVAWCAFTGANAVRLATAMPLLVLMALSAFGGKAGRLALARWRLLRLAARTEARLRHHLLVSMKG
jgi:hypothetical protein